MLKRMDKMFGKEQSNAALKQAADQAGKAADVAHADAEDGGGTHARAERLNREASYAHQRAGNATKAKQYRQQAQVHAPKAQAERTMGNAAQSLSQQAHDAGQSASLREHGEDPEPEYGEKDTRTASERHAAAAELHAQAGKAHEAAGNKREAAYHAAKALKHQMAAEG